MDKDFRLFQNRYFYNYILINSSLQQKIFQVNILSNDLKILVLLVPSFNWLLNYYGAKCRAAFEKI